MENKKKTQENKKETWYPFRNLANYKSTNLKAAEAKGKRDAFLAAPTLTAARRIAYGIGK